MIPGHVLTSLLLLGIEAQSHAGSRANAHIEERIFEWLLPAAAAVFVFASIPRQMKNFFVSGLVFFAAGVYRLQQNVFPGKAAWPIGLLALGLLLMIAAAYYAPIKVALRGVRGRRNAGGSKAT